jgi:ankyrin repeat protein
MTVARHCSDTAGTHENINTKDNKNKTPLQVAVYKENVDIVRVLLKYNTNINA